MTPPQHESGKSRWEVAGTIIGVLSGALALVVGIVGLPQHVAKALGRSDSQAARQALAQTERKLAAAGPRLDVTYLVLSSHLVFDLDVLEQQKKPKPSREATTLLSFPIVATEVINAFKSNQEPTSGCTGDYLKSSLTFLVIRNRGRRDATGVAVDIDALRLQRAVRVHEATVGGDDYVAKLRTSATVSQSGVIPISQTLAPGEGVRIPLWISFGAPGRYDRWCVTSRMAFLPRSVSFTDPELGSTTRAPVRRMVAPTMFAVGVGGRG